MQDTEIQVSLGELSFSGKGDPDWLGKQLDKLLDKYESLHETESESKKSNRKSGDPSDSGNKSAKTTLPTFLKRLGVTTNQNDRFLGTAIWLIGNGTSDVTTKDVTSALNTAHLGKLTNPAICLNRNVKKGFCQKNGSGFYVTPEGKGHFGIDD